jgi:hypothetical protein
MVRIAAAPPVSNQCLGRISRRRNPPNRSACVGGAIRYRALRSWRLICPSGKISARIENLSSPASKNISLFPKPKSDVSMIHPVPARGAFRDRHERGAGCGGRNSIERRTMLAADGEVVWS